MSRPFCTGYNGESCREKSRHYVQGEGDKIHKYCYDCYRKAWVAAMVAKKPLVDIGEVDEVKDVVDVMEA